MGTLDIKRILVAVDEKGLAVDAIERAARLAHSLGAEVRAVHAVEVPLAPWPGASKQELDELRAKTMVAARERVLEVIGRAQERTDVELPTEDDLVVSPGRAAKVLLGEAAELRADLLVIGPHTDRSRFDFGSTTRALLGHATVPVWAQVGAVTPVRRVLATIDFSDHSRHVLEYSVELCRRLEATLEVLHCYSPPLFAYATTPDGVAAPAYVIEQERKSLREMLERWTGECGLDGARATFREGEIVETVLQVAEGADLVVLGTHGRTGLTRFLLGSVAYGVLSRASKPVLVVPSKQQSWLLGAPEQTVAASVE